MHLGCGEARPGGEPLQLPEEDGADHHRAGGAALHTHHQRDSATGRIQGLWIRINLCGSGSSCFSLDPDADPDLALKSLLLRITKISVPTSFNPCMICTVIRKYVLQKMR